MSDQRRRNARKTALQMFSQLLWLMGLVVGLGGVYLLMKYSHSGLFFSNAYITMPAALALASAALLLVDGVLGSWLSVRDSTFLQGLFVYLLVVVFCLQSSASALAYFHSVKLDSEMAPLSGLFHNYTDRNQDRASKAVDATQRESQCCGVQNYTDWHQTPWFNRTGGRYVPISCCNSATFPRCNGSVERPWQLYNQGCQARLETSFQFVLSFIFWCGPVLFLVEVFNLVAVAQLMKDPPFVEYHMLYKH